MELSIIILIIIATCLAVFFLRKRKNQVKICILAGCICLGCVCFYGAYQLFFYYNQEQVEIHISSDDDDTLVLPVKNHKLKYEYTNARFSSEMQLKEIADCIKNSNSVNVVDVLEDEIKLTSNNRIITVKQEESDNFLWKKRYVYVMDAKNVNVSFAKDQMISIPFPTDYLEIEGAYETVMAVSCNMEQLKKFYEHFTNVSFENDVITLELKEGQNIKMTLHDKKIKFEKMEV